MDRLDNLLTAHYALEVHSVQPAPRGFVAETYRVWTTQEQSYFVKIFPLGRLPRHALASLPLLPELYRLGLTNIPVPLTTTTGAWYTDDADTVVVVLGNIVADHTSTYDLRSFGELVAQLHHLTEFITMPCSHETFDLPYAAQLQARLRSAMHQPPRDKVVAGLQQFIEEYVKEIQQDWAELESVAAQCRSATPRHVLTHGDAPGNVLSDARGNIYLVDWDEVLLAPPERDTWFLLDEPAFLKGYLSVFGEYKPNLLTYRFYLLNRYFEDLFGYVEEILGHGSPEHRAWNLDELHKTCRDWLRPLIRT